MRTARSCAAVCPPRRIRLDINAGEVAIALFTHDISHILFTPKHPAQQNQRSSLRPQKGPMAFVAQQQRLSALSSSSTQKHISSSVMRPSQARTRRAAVAVSAANLPQGVSAPKRLPVAPEAKFGFVYNAERLNSRACMMGFIGTLIVEAITHKPVLELFGFSVGQGLGFEL
jgi:hypothetical protein